MLQLYTYYRSVAAHRVRIALNYKGIAYCSVFIDLESAAHLNDDYLKLNPQGLVPALETDDGILISQSVAILEWLEELHPQPPLLPGDPLQRALVRSAVNSIVCDIHPLNNMSVTNYLQASLGSSPEEVQQWYQQWIYRGFDGIERTLESQSGACCFGDEPGMADVCLIPQVYNALRFKVPMEAYPNIMRVWEHCNGLHAFQLAHPDAQPDTPVSA